MFKERVKMYPSVGHSYSLCVYMCGGVFVDVFCVCVLGDCFIFVLPCVYITMKNDTPWSVTWRWQRERVQWLLPVSFFTPFFWCSPHIIKFLFIFQLSKELRIVPPTLWSLLYLACFLLGAGEHLLIVDNVHVIEPQNQHEPRWKAKIKHI